MIVVCLVLFDFDFGMLWYRFVSVVGFVCGWFSGVWWLRFSVWGLSSSFGLGLGWVLSGVFAWWFCGFAVGWIRDWCELV